MKYILPLFLLLASAIASAQIPHFKHVVVVVEENHSYSHVIGNPAMPYLNHLASTYGLAKYYYANTHPSIGNYFMLTTGRIITNSDSYTGTVTSNNVVQQLLTAGKTWKVYAESLPYTGYIGGDRFPYVKHHNPIAYFSDVRNSSTERSHIVSTTHLSTDLSNNALPSYAFVVPNVLHDAHNCPYGGTCSDNQKLAAADSWLKYHVGPIISNAAFKASGVLVIVFDESTTSDTAHGGGHVAAVVVSSQSKTGYKSTVFHQHQSVLKLACSAFSLSSCPGAAASVSAPAEFFK
ncbi:MAG TPA: alkaline phosphatase family protein [Terriglobales bacterium]|nr:alkaline phosphatase family protein [Terriglobales bacterium]